MSLSLLQVHGVSRWLTAKQTMNAVFAFFFFLKRKSLSDFFWIVKMGTNVGLSQKWSGITWIFKKWEISLSSPFFCWASLTRMSFGQTKYIWNWFQFILLSNLLFYLSVNSTSILHFFKFRCVFKLLSFLRLPVNHQMI